MTQITDDNGLTYKLNSKDHTAIIVESKLAKDDLFIPRTINHLNEDYVITEMHQPFDIHSKIKSITFAKDSEIRKFGKYLFFGSQVEKKDIQFYLNSISRYPIAFQK